MKFEIKSTRNKENCIYKTLYLKQCLFMQIEEIAAKYDTSFNNVVISMIEACLSDGLASYENCANTSPPPLAAPPLQGRRREGSP